MPCSHRGHPSPHRSRTSSGLDGERRSCRALRGLRLAPAAWPALLPGLWSAQRVAQPTARGASATCPGSLAGRPVAECKRDRRRWSPLGSPGRQIDPRAFLGLRSPVGSDAPLLAGFGGARVDVSRLRGDPRRRGGLTCAGHARRVRRSAREAHPPGGGARRLDRDARSLLLFVQRTARCGSRTDSVPGHPLDPGQVLLGRFRALGLGRRQERRCWQERGCRQSARARAERLELEAAADQARVRDHALRSALRVGVRALLDVPVPLPDPRAPRRAPGALLRGRTRTAGERDRADQWSGTHGGNRLQLPHLQRHRPCDGGRRRTGHRPGLCLPELDPDAPRAAHRQALDLAGIPGRDGRRGLLRRGRRVWTPGAWRGRLDLGADPARGADLRHLA